MRHFVQYHNTENMGALRINAREFDAWTSRLMSDLIGVTIWMIVGKEKPRKYHLAYRFIADDIDEAPADTGKKYRILGRTGLHFKPWIELNTLPWCTSFLKSQQNFRRGLFPIQEEFVRELEALTSLKSVGREQVLHGIDRFDKECRGTAQWRDWQTKESQKYALIFGDQWYPPKMILSLGTGIPRRRFSGGIERTQANGILELLGFRVLTISHTKDGYVQPEESGWNAEPSETYEAEGTDTRELVNRTIRMRRGQQAFRSSLRERYGDVCLISGCKLLDILEAAHIKPYRGEADNHVENGLLLRADLHTLFDLDLIGIEPDTLIVRVHPRAKVAGYELFDGQRLRCCDKVVPNMHALEQRWKLFKERSG